MGKLTIKPLDRAPRLPATYATESWGKLQATIGAVYSKGPLPGGSKEEVYRTVEAMCVNGMESKLAQFLRSECDNHIRMKLAVASAPAAAVNALGVGDDALLRAMYGIWQDHCEATQTISALFTYLDRTYIISQRPSPSNSQPCERSIREISVHLFRAQLDLLSDVRDKTLLALLRSIDAERRGSEASQALLTSLVGMVSKLGIYEANFEPAVLEHTAEFYRTESQELQPKMSAAEYLRHCERRLQEEAKRCEAHFEKRTAPALLDKARAELLRQHCDKLLDSGFGTLVQEHRVEDLERLYRLFSEVDALPGVRKAWSQAIKQIGVGIMANGEDPEESKAIVPALLDLRARLSEVLAKAFQSSSVFTLGMKDAFEEFLSAGSQNLPAKLLARHIDEVLRNEKACSDRELEDAIENLVGIFRFVATKDAFEAFYKKDLAKRLLLGRSSSNDAEQLMIQKLRDECGSGFTSKLEGMFRDIEVSKGIYETYAARPESKQTLEDVGIELNVNVLTSGLWPTQPPSPDISYPSGPRMLQETFASFYASHYAGRSLRWSPLLGQCTLRASYEGGVRKELIVSHFQALVLLLFNNVTSLSCQEIGNQTAIPSADLHRTLQSLALHKYVKLLTKEPKTREVADQDVFTYNAGFTHKMYRVAVTQISPKEQHEEEAGVERRVFEDRQHEVDAAVVRIMKVKKTLSHQQLVQEVFNCMSFPVTAADVKRRVESLLEREYLERDNERPSTYTYLA